MSALVLALALLAHADDVEPPDGADASGAPALPDRSRPPPVRDPVLMELAEAEVHPLGPGATAWLVQVPGVREVEVHVWLHRGSLDLDGWPTPEAAITGWIQDSASERWPLEQLARDEDLHDLDVVSWMLHTHSGVDLTVPLESLDLGIQMLDDVLRRPTFPRKELRRVKKEYRFFYRVTGPTDPSVVAGAALTHAWFPEDHPFGARPDLDGWERVRPPALRERHQWLLAESPLTVLVVGDLSWEDAQPRLEVLTQGLGTPGAPSAQPAFEPPSSSRVLAVDMPGTDQVVVRLRTAAPTRDDPDALAFGVVDYALGGAFLSRLNANLREDKGLTYGAWSSHVAQETRGHWTVSFDVAAADLAVAVREVDRELAAVVDAGLSPSEVHAAHNATIGEWNRTLQNAGSAVGFYESRLESGEGVAELRSRIEALEGLTPERTAALAEQWLGEERPRHWVFVGPGDTIAAQLEVLGWTAEWITPSDAVMGWL